MRQQVASSLDKPSQIFAQAVVNQDHAVQKRFPCEENTKRSLRYHRRTPTMPEHLHDFTLPYEWKDTLGSNPQQFLLYDNRPEAVSRIIAFATLEDLRRLAAAEAIYMDGNFKMAPAQFRIRQELFDVVVDRITRFGINLHVQTVVTDFEDAVLRAISTSFDLEFRRFCSMLDGLAFLPTEEVNEGMEHLKTVTPAEAAELVDYFDTTYVSGSYRSQQL
ncbi:hypothetical protein E2C01_063358 [Portunus trituberculatus]|uniref:Uncharacterized protein n=1 Tax=Portunus trituberculatus TaxID=210409 RepID=A0A5B7HG53_PORTR|nr:hypothetical protein [Portunus trituberculatus]